MILGNRLSTEAYARVYGEEGDYGTIKYMGLVDVALKPHLGNTLFPQNNKEVLLEVTKDYRGTVYGLSDDSAIVVDSDDTYLIGSDPVKIVDGVAQ